MGLLFLILTKDFKGYILFYEQRIQQEKFRMVQNVKYSYKVQEDKSHTSLKVDTVT